MRVTIERSAFLRALNHVQSVVERRNTIPILSNVLVEATGSQLKLTATDLDIEIVESVEAEVTRAGATTVPAHMLYDIVRKLPDGAQLELEQSSDQGRISIFAGKSRFALQALPPLGVGLHRARQPQPGPIIARVAPDGLPKQLACAGVVTSFQCGDALAQQPFCVVVMCGCLQLMFLFRLSAPRPG
jgi:hypothetical protein